VRNLTFEKRNIAPNVPVVHDVPEPLAAQACPRFPRTLPFHSLRGKAARTRGRGVKYSVELNPPSGIARPVL
jgi:hypothetical protein